MRTVGTAIALCLNMKLNLRCIAICEAAPEGNQLTAHSRLRAANPISVWLRAQTGSIALLLAIGLAGCTDAGREDIQTSETTSAMTVSAAERGSCSTMVVLGLSRQIAAEISCMMPGQLERFTPTANIKFASNAVLPYLAPDAINSVKRAAAGTTITINSGFRTIAQQHLLYRWKQLGRCNLTAVARPGRSNHESGRALDVSNYSAMLTRMRNQGWSHNVPGDEVHFEFLSAADIRGADVQAFQRLWNRNHPEDQIAEDGDYGPVTAARLSRSPGEGFATGASCDSGPTETLPLASEIEDDAENDDEIDDETDQSDQEGQEQTDSTFSGGCSGGAGGSAGGLATLLFAIMFGTVKRSTRRGKSRSSLIGR
jgi:hypothetical protein